MVSVMERKEFEERFLELGFTMDQISNIQDYGASLIEVEEIEDGDEYDARELALQYMIDELIDADDDYRAMYLEKITGSKISDDVIEKLIERMEMDW